MPDIFKFDHCRPGVMDVTPEGLKLVELAPGVSREQIQAKTGVPLV
jgi:3-oxoacid CoA-transferase subunit B